MQQSDFLIVGSGIAGLSYALKISNLFPDKTISILTKSSAEESNSNYAQGGIAAVFDNINDTFSRHIEDTLIAGDSLCDPDIVKMVVTDGPFRIMELQGWGVKFDQQNGNKLHLGLEGGHSVNRIVHRKDHTGGSVIDTLLRRVKECPNIELRTNIFTIDLIMNKDRSVCYGVSSMNLITEETEDHFAPIIVLATGGSNRIYRYTTNPSIATGDGIAMAYRAGIRIKDMEFVQFHPTAFHDPDADQSFLISEAVRGAGAKLINKKGESFMRLYDPRGDLSSRDIVARSIINELRISGDENVYLDVRHLDQKKFRQQFPVIVAFCERKGIEPDSDLIPVAPAAHFNSGGILVNTHGQTSVSNLFAVGECACTGLHGANRLASNSLLEGLVFANRAFLKSATMAEVKSTKKVKTRRSNSPIKDKPDMRLIKALTLELRQLMSQNASIIRNHEDMKATLDVIRVIGKHVDEMTSRKQATDQLFELRNLLVIAKLILEHSIERKENRGVFFCVDLVADSSINEIIHDESLLEDDLYH